MDENVREIKANTSAPAFDGGVDLIDLIAYYWRKKWILLLAAFIGGLLGFGYCALKRPLYYSQAILTPKKSERQGMSASLLSQLGGVGGMVAAQLGFGDNNLDKMEIVLKSRELADSVITRNNLLPVLFPGRWDAEKKQWKQDKHGRAPTMRAGVDLLRSRVLAVTANSKKELLNVGILFYDPEWCVRLASMYVEELNRKIQTGVIRDAEFNKDYLQAQLAKAFDPLLQEKIQELIAMQVETAMLVSSKSFSVLEAPALPLHPDRPKKKLTILLFSFLSVVSTAIAVGGARYWMFIRPRFEEKLGKGASL